MSGFNVKLKGSDVTPAEQRAFDEWVKTRDLDDCLAVAIDLFLTGRGAMKVTSSGVTRVAPDDIGNQ